MLTRRRFLSHTGLGMLAATAGCRPQHISWLFDQEQPNTESKLSLASKSALVAKKGLVLGYPINMITPPDEFFSWRQQLNQVGIGRFAYNNVGNPFRQSSISYNTHDFEQELILRFGELFAFPRESTWGFLSNSGTDSNMHGMYMGRTILKGQTGVIPKAYFTKEAHYSIQILQDLLGLEWVVVETQQDGSMNPEDLREKLAARSDHPALVIATVGTTFKGAIDPVDRIQQALRGHPSYLHLDAALFGGYLPYTAHAKELLYRSSAIAGAPRYDSIAVSCHKFFGFPAPAGLFITTQKRFHEFHGLFSRVHNPEYIRHVPGTITCSRDAVKPAEFFFFSTPSASARQSDAARAMLQRTAYLSEQMSSHFAHLQPIRANDRSNTVYFRKPSDSIVRKYSLATMHLERNNNTNTYAHVLVMPHVTREIIDDFLTDLAEDSSTVAS